MKWVIGTDVFNKGRKIFFNLTEGCIISRRQAATHTPEHTSISYSTMSGEEGYSLEACIVETPEEIFERLGVTALDVRTNK